MIRRRDFIAGLGSAAAWSVAARAQQGERVRRIGVLITFDENDPVGKSQLSALTRALADLGWTVGRNVRMDVRWAGGDPNRTRAFAQELVGLQPDILVGAAGGSTAALQRETQTIPIVFANVGDPVGTGFVAALNQPVAMGLIASLSRPGGNLTGVTNLNVELGPKKLELLHRLVPAATIIGLLVNPANPNSEIMSKGMQAAARTLGVELDVLRASTEGEIDTAFASLVQARAGALVISPDPFFVGRTKKLAALTVRHALPAVYEFREFVAAGGLMSYGSDLRDAYRLVGVYTGRILKGDKPADLPVQQSTKLELAINLKTAKALGLTIPETLLATADEVIQ
jgi:putative ABC transport system substrate-binding protein